MSDPRRHAGIKVRHTTACESPRHSDSCGRRTGGRCTCEAAKRDAVPCTCSPSYQAAAYDRSSRKTLYSRRYTGKNALKAASQWRRITLGNLEAGRSVVSSRKTLRQASEEFLLGAESSPPTVLTRQGRRYKPSALRDIRAALEQRILPDLGGLKLADVRRGDVQALVNRMLGEGLSGSRVRNVVNALRSVYRHAMDLEEVVDSPCKNLRLPASDGKRERIADSEEAAELLAALPAEDRALWACALYAGLRLGEIQALSWENVDLTSGFVRVRAGWDEVEGRIAPKSESAVRDVPIIGRLRHHLVEQRLRCEWSAVPDALVFGRSPRAAFIPSTVVRRAQKHWRTAGLEGIGLHESRHSYASLLIEADVNLKKVTTYMGHSSVTITLDRYGHLLPDAADDGVGRVDAYHAARVRPGN